MSLSNQLEFVVLIFQQGGNFIPSSEESDGLDFSPKGARIRASLHRKDGKLSPLFVGMDDREEEEKEEEGLLLFGEQSLTRFPHRDSRRNIYENVSSLSSLSYLPFLQIVSISAYSKFSNRHLWLPSNVRDLSNFPIAVRRGFWIHFLYPRTRIPLSIRSQTFLNVLVKPSNTSRIFQLNTFRNFASFFREWKKKKKKNYSSSLQVFYYS